MTVVQNEASKVPGQTTAVLMVVTLTCAAAAIESNRPRHRPGFRKRSTGYRRRRQDPALGCLHTSSASMPPWVPQHEQAVFLVQRRAPVRSVLAEIDRSAEPVCF